MSVFGKTVRARREELGLAQERLAAELGVTQQTVSRWENGMALPRPARLLALARILDLDPGMLHRVAGHLPTDESLESTSAWQEVFARVPQLSRTELMRLMDRAWQELRTREESSPRPMT